MSRKYLKLLGLCAIAVIIASPVMLTITPVTLAKHGGKKGKVSWSQNPVTATVAAGDSFTATLTFTSTTDLDNVTLDTTPSVRSQTTVSPSTFATVSAGVPYTVEVTFTAPTNGDRSAYNGNVHLRTKHKNHPANLRLRFTVPVSETVGTH